MNSLQRTFAFLFLICLLTGGLVQAADTPSAQLLIDTVEAIERSATSDDDASGDAEDGKSDEEKALADSIVGAVQEVADGHDSDPLSNVASAFAAATSDDARSRLDGPMEAFVDNLSPQGKAFLQGLAQNPVLVDRLLEAFKR